MLRVLTEVTGISLMECLLDGPFTSMVELNELTCTVGTMVTHLVYVTTNVVNNNDGWKTVYVNSGIAIPGPA